MGQIYISSKLIKYDDSDEIYFSGEWLWHLHPTKNNIYLRGYKKGFRKDGLVYFHRLKCKAKKGQDVDHKNGDGLDNRGSNLRLCSRSQNNANRQKTVKSSSKYKGVYFDSQTGKWRSEITFNGVRYRLGRFDTEKEAAKAYFEKASNIFGEFAHQIKD